MIFRRSKRKPFLSYNKRLYHGTTSNFTDAKSDVNRLPCDHGLGFYLTPFFDRTTSRAEEKVFNEDSVVQVYLYIFDDERAQQDANDGKLWFETIVPCKQWLDSTEFFWDRSIEGALYKLRTDAILIMPSPDATVERILTRYRNSARTDADVKQALEDLNLDRYGTQYYFGTDKNITKYLTFVGKYIRGKDGKFRFYRRL